jgi:hypothetical protein
MGGVGAAGTAGGAESANVQKQGAKSSERRERTGFERTTYPPLMEFLEAWLRVRIIVYVFEHFARLRWDS